ncbi:MAG: hypothetical protein KAI66_25470, partial [Lentisphaeria bacterium]|nr:hypothetical protein [Lentisphaeria bacterium]
GVEVAEGYAYVIGDYGGLFVISVDDPAALEIVATLSIDGYGVAIDVDGDLAFIAANGLHIVSIADPRMPVELGALTSDQLAVSVFAADDVVFLGDGSILRIISVSDPSHPIELGMNALGLGPRVSVVGEYAITALEWRGVRILSIADPTYIHEVTGIGTADRAVGTALSGDYIYVADQDGGLFILRLVLEDDAG